MKTTPTHLDIMATTTSLTPKGQNNSSILWINVFCSFR